MKRIIPYTQNQEMINLALECQGTEEFEHTVNDQILHELIELRKFVERVETDINRPVWMHIRDGFRDIWNALKGGTS